MKILHLDQIQKILNIDHAIDSIKEGFIAYSENRTTVPPVGHLGFDDPKGDCHIKSGYIDGDDYFVIKIATGFYGNQSTGSPSSTGMMILSDAKCAAFKAILIDESYLTDIRTAIAGLIVAELLAPRDPENIGIIGTGIQARLQVELLKKTIKAKNIFVWGRSPKAMAEYELEMTEKGYKVYKADTPKDVAARCDLIVTATASGSALLKSEWLLPGTHITAVGADAPGKQELDPAIFAKADIVCVDSRSQCLDHGDTAHAVSRGLISEDRLIEIGELLKSPHLARQSSDQITIADLTGVAVQDIQIAKAVYEASKKAG